MLGTSINLEIGDITEDELKDAISKIVNDTRQIFKFYVQLENFTRFVKSTFIFLR